jgi:hypothetical protein
VWGRAWVEAAAAGELVPILPQTSTGGSMTSRYLNGRSQGDTPERGAMNEQTSPASLLDALIAKMRKAPETKESSDPGRLHLAVSSSEVLAFADELEALRPSLLTSEPPRDLLGALFEIESVARDIGTVMMVAERPGVKGPDHEQMIAKLNSWRARLFAASDKLEAQSPIAEPESEKAPSVVKDWMTAAAERIDGEYPGPRPMNQPSIERIAAIIDQSARAEKADAELLTLRQERDRQATALGGWQPININWRVRIKMSPKGRDGLI